MQPALVWLAVGTLCSSAAATTKINVLGTVDLLSVETTPLVIEGKLYRFENIHPYYWNNTKSSTVTGPSYLRIVDVATGTFTEPFGLNHALGCAIYDPTTKTVYAFATSADSSSGGDRVDVFWSSDGMHTWKAATAVDIKALKRKVYNTSVTKGKLNGTDIWVMAYETWIEGTPGGWNTAFATAQTPVGPWTVLDPTRYNMEVTVEHANPALRYMEIDAYWYCITARRTPTKAPNGGWYFFTEVFRSKDLLTWEAGIGMGSNSTIGTPLLSPNATRDHAIAPASKDDAHADGNDGWITASMASFLNKGQIFWSLAPDVNLSDMDLVEWRNQTVMYFNAGEQHRDNSLILAVADMPLAQFLRSFFVPPSILGTASLETRSEAVLV